MDTQEQKIIWRSYSSVFVLDSAKLSRLTNLIEDRFKSLDLTPIRHFELHTQKGKAFSAQSLEHILEHDNAVKNPIVTLKITFNDKADDPRHEQAKDLDGSVPLVEYVNLKSALVLLPAVVIILSLAYLIKYCYPGSVFFWGDFIEHYNAIIERRKFVWSTIVISLLVGILGNLFVFGLSPVIT